MMKLFVAVVMILAGGCAWAQKPACTEHNAGQIYFDKKTGDVYVCEFSGKENQWMQKIGAKSPDPAPLKCGKYEYLEPAHYGDSCEHMEMTPSGTLCAGIGMQLPDRCVPILHTLTEKDWQELMARLKALEHKEK